MVRRRGTLTPSKGTHRRGFLSVPAPSIRVDSATSPRGTASLQQPQTPYAIALGEQRIDSANFDKFSMAGEVTQLLDSYPFKGADREKIFWKPDGDFIFF